MIAPARRTGSARTTLWVCAALYLPFVFLGYGADVDTYTAIAAGERVLDGEAYRPSRPPGFFLHELGSALLSRLGGSLLTNGATAAAALLAIACFLDLARRRSIPHRRLLALLLAAHPYFWIAATSTIDDAWAIAGLLLGLALLDRDRPVSAGLAWGLAAGFRLSALPVGAAILVGWSSCGRSRRAAAGLIASAVAAACYVPSFVHAGHTLGFLYVAAGPRELWTLAGHAGRFVFKNVSLFLGLPATVFVLCVLPFTLRALGRAWGGGWKPILAPSLLALAASELLFLRYPLHPSHLLPGLPFLLLVLGIAWRDRRRWLIAAGSLILSTNFLVILLARPDVPNRATRAHFGLWVERGALVRDLQLRLELRTARSVADWQRVVQGGPAPP